MLFNSLTYLLFLPVVTMLFWFAPKRARNLILLAASYIFYMSWMKIYGLLLFGLTLINFLLGIFLDKTQTQSKKRLVFVAGLAVNLGALVLFKYTNFLIDAFTSCNHFVAQVLNLDALRVPALGALPIILPLGISFFVFEFIHYLVDVFKGAKPVTSPVRFGLFAAFFPSQIAGPIKRFQEFEQQLVEGVHFQPELFRSGVYLIAQGLFKKVALGDNLAAIVQVGFSNPSVMGTWDAWLCVLAFSLQIYYDFSGYTDIGRGSAMVLGFSLPENFNMPYLATSLRDFWHRWHISLSTWLRDYLYIPLGGSRKGKSSSAINLMITMLLGGLWHGASWHFVAWGAFHGGGLALNRVLDELIAKNETLSRLSKTWVWTVFATASTFLMVSLAWVVFRANNMAEAMAVYRSMFQLQSWSSPETSICELLLQSTLPLAFTIYGLAYFGCKYWAANSHRIPHPLQNFRVPVYAQAIVLAGFGLLVLGLSPLKSVPFIYFQF